MNQSLPLTAAGLTDPGMQRENNEDFWSGPPPNLPPELVATKGYLYIVADGVGGHQGGEVASRIAVQVTQQVYYSDPNPDIKASLRAAIEEANRRIYHQGVGNAKEYGMSTTITAAVVRGNQLVVANVGDSRTYLIKGAHAHQLTVDHTWVAERVAAGVLTPQEAANHPQRNVITRSLGGNLEVQVDVFGPHPLAPGDQVLMCTDGLSDLVSDQEIAAVVTQSRTPGAAVRGLVDLAKKRGAPDNVTAVMVGVGRQKGGPMPGNLVALVGILGAVTLLAIVGFVLLRHIVPAVMTPEAAPTSTPLPTTAMTQAPAAAATPLPAATATPLPAVELTAPEDGAGFYPYRPVSLAWTWPITPNVKRRFVVAVEDSSGRLLFTDTVELGKGMEYTFVPRNEHLKAGIYRWKVWVKEMREGKWERVPGTEAEARTFRVLPPPTPTFTPTPTETPTPTPTTPPPSKPKPPPKVPSR